MDTEPIVNKVAQSDLITFDLEKFWDGNEVVSLDLAPFLFKGLILKEHDFRKSVKDLDTGLYSGKHVAVHCSSKAVIPTWAFMLVAAKLGPTVASVAYGTAEDLVRDHLASRLAGHDWSVYEGRNVIVKGCPSPVIPVSAYLDVVSRLQPVAAKIMYGEACSSVPIWRKQTSDSGRAPARAGTAMKAVAAALPKSK